MEFLTQNSDTILRIILLGGCIVFLAIAFNVFVDDNDDNTKFS